ncbi:ASCH domain-containing protein [Sphingomonas koreensis]|uniref:ASCH domain-containing protein n=1 Tax=Sphingomonas koreensis TaxID=93064 RepID=UPI000F7F5796|nr:ASCH domain-containing protein [Sphingomonas koreensis]RSU21220.1 ASCH domain-containing protein [Sphingomonas koreensis]RSU32215.1 ASCH domain-containing protein [Sphingomonas koreensis]RSU35709.1 ASCH domain-containing protein [Sphingomonas koreensis]RSU49880.1 ASCH domain-containing protein [Sphingomonas koreensis]RSU83475.1 ASCH domain-containing protein [Sphingomonas koreensis]
MVAYSFAPRFADAVARGIKRQTVRGPRRRHARAGEPVQLYAGMRTKQCRKLVAADPIVREVRHIEIAIDRGLPWVIAGISIDGVPLDDYSIERFAAADGFAGGPMSARREMGLFWLAAHPGVEHFEGVVIHWGDA